MADPTVELTVEADELKTLLRKLHRVEDGAALRQRLEIEIREVANQGRDALRSTLAAVPHRGKATARPPLGSYLASRTEAESDINGATVGLHVTVAKTPQLRNFREAARMLNQRSWRHKVFGHDVTVEQRSPVPNYVQKTLKPEDDRFLKAVQKVMTRYANFIIHGKWGL